MMPLPVRFAILLGLRWFATGLIVPVSVLLPLERGLSLSELGLAMAAQGAVVLILEVPSGALTDSWGRRPVFMASAAVAIAAYALAMSAQNVAGFTAAWAVTGVFRALDSGPLEAWFVDAEYARGAAADVPSGLARAGGIIGISIAAGSLTSAAIVAWAPVSESRALSLPYFIAICVVIAQCAAAWLLMEPAPVRQDKLAGSWAAALRDGVRIATRPGLRSLVLAMSMASIGVFTLEAYMPVRLAELTGDGERAAAQMGLIAAAAWGISAVGAWTVSRTMRGRNPRLFAVGLITGEACGLVLMAVAGGPGLLIAGFWCGYLVHSGFGAAFNSLVHVQVDDARRGTALSMTSMAFLGSAALSSVVMGALAERSSPSIALSVGSLALILAALTIALATPRTPATPPGGGGSRT